MVSDSEGRAEDHRTEINGLVKHGMVPRGSSPTSFKGLSGTAKVVPSQTIYEIASENNVRRNRKLEAKG